METPFICVINKTKRKGINVKQHRLRSYIYEQIKYLNPWITYIYDMGWHQSMHKSNMPASIKTTVLKVST